MTLIELLVTILTSIVVPFSTWLLLRAVRGVDEKFEEHSKKLDTLATTLDVKTSMLVTRDEEHTVKLVAHEVRLAHVEAELVHLRGKYESLGGFLQALGYKIREDAPAPLEAPKESP